jgi:para-nitrobenzyl esterase
MPVTLDTTLGTLLDNPQAKAILEQYVPGISTNPMVAMAKGLTLNMLLAMPQAAQLGLTKEKAEMILAEINKQVKI